MTECMKATLHTPIDIERMRTWARKRKRGGESSTVRKLVGRAEGGIKAGGPRQARTRKQRKISNWNQVS